MDTERTDESTQEELEGGSRAGRADDTSSGAQQAEGKPGEGRANAGGAEPLGDDRPIIINPGEGGSGGS